MASPSPLARVALAAAVVASLCELLTGTVSAAYLPAVASADSPEEPSDPPPTVAAFATATAPSSKSPMVLLTSVGSFTGPVDSRTSSATQAADVSQSSLTAALDTLALRAGDCSLLGANDLRSDDLIAADLSRASDTSVRQNAR